MQVGHKHTVALLIIDMLNTLEFPEWRSLLKSARPAARAICRLKARARRLKIPVIYVNDNFGQWRASWQDVFEACSLSNGHELAKQLKPEAQDYFVLKPKHSGFYSTTLEVLLERLGSRTLILTGVAGNICVLFTANDAHMREYKVIVPEDCIASNTLKDNAFALEQLRDVFGIRTTPSSRLKLDRVR